MKAKDVIIKSIFLYGVSWILICTIMLPVITILGWTNGDYLLLTFNEYGEKPIELVLVPVGCVCAIIVACEVIRKIIHREPLFV